MPRKAKSSDTWVVVERTVRTVVRMPLDQDHYPDMNHVEAVDYELRLAREDKLEAFVDAMTNDEPGAVELTERVYVE